MWSLLAAALLWLGVIFTAKALEAHTTRELWAYHGFAVILFLNCLAVVKGQVVKAVLKRVAR